MTSLPDSEIRALHDALDDAYHAWSVYSQVLQDERDSEQRHIQALHHLFQRYNLPIPPNPWGTATVPRFKSLQEASEAGVQAEIDNVDLYKRILGATERPEILQVFRQLQAASQQRHLPAFQRAALRYRDEAGSVEPDGRTPGSCGGGQHHCSGRGGRRRRHGSGTDQRFER